MSGSPVRPARPARPARPGDYDAIAAVIDAWWGRPILAALPRLGGALYQDFFALARADGRRVVNAVTAPVNSGSIRFHRSMGFAATGPVTDYNGPGLDLVVFERLL